MKRWTGMLILIVISAALVVGLGFRPDNTPLPTAEDDTPAQTPAADDTPEPAPEEDDPTVPKKVSTEISDTTGTLKVQLIEATPISLTYTLDNISPGYVYHYGTPYAVQQMIDGEWYSVPELPLPEGVGRAWTTQAFVLRAGKTREETENWANIYGELPKGQYRLVKGLAVYYSESVYDNPRLPLYKLVDEHYTVAIEFTIE